MHAQLISRVVGAVSGVDSDWSDGLKGIPGERGDWPPPPADFNPAPLMLPYYGVIFLAFAIGTAAFVMLMCWRTFRLRSGSAEPSA